MSTKIHNGYRIRCDIARLYDRLIGVAPQFQKIANDEIMRIKARAAVRSFDAETANFGMPMMGGNHLAEATRRIEESFAQASSGRRAYPDFDSSITLFPLSSHVLVLSFISDPQQRDFFRSLRWSSQINDGGEGFTPWGYWDNEDPPEGISEADFKLRGRTWEFVMGPQMVPAHRGLTFQLSSNQDARLHMMTHSEDILEYLPFFHERCQTIAYDRVLAAKIRALTDENGEAKALEHFNSAMAWMKTEEGSNAKLEEAARLRDTLKPEPTLKDLRGWPTEEEITQ